MSQENVVELIRDIELRYNEEDQHHFRTDEEELHDEKKGFQNLKLSIIAVTRPPIEEDCRSGPLPFRSRKYNITGVVYLKPPPQSIPSSPTPRLSLEILAGPP